MIIIVFYNSLILEINVLPQAAVFIDNHDGFKEECRSWDVYTMLISYSICSSILFCFTFSFLFSLCILGSPLLRNHSNIIRILQNKTKIFYEYLQ